MRPDEPFPLSRTFVPGPESVDLSDLEDTAPRVGRAALALVEAPLALVEAGVAQPEIEVIGSVIETDATTALSCLASAPGPALASLRVLRHRLERHRGDGHSVISVVSPRAGEGKTTVAVRLAMILSEAARARVALVEGNLERPALARVLGLRLPEGAGLSHQIRRRLGGRTGPFGVVRIAPSLFVMAEPVLESVCSEVLHSTHFEHAISVLRESYDYVVIDGSSVLGSGDANVLENLSDSVILVARAGVTRGRDLRQAERQLGERRVLGTVLNDLVPHAWGDSGPKPGKNGSLS
jgi:Mrp family chromosome partitioning ATPase